MFRSKTYSRTDRIHRSSFNPCSRGCFARSLGDDLHRVICGVFQSLFSWMFRSKRVHIVGSLFWVNVSILVLVDVSLEAVVLRSLIQVPCVSILVLVDVSLEETDPIVAGTYVKFQSLFSWMFRSKMQDKSTSWRISSFNPCSRGCFARSPPRGVHIAMRSGFNPCSRGCFARSLTMQYLPDNMVGFNPCSRGCFARSSARVSHRGSPGVSILVLVDVSLEVFVAIHSN